MATKAITGKAIKKRLGNKPGSPTPQANTQPTELLQTTS